jgi:hypothetical protein
VEESALARRTSFGQKRRLPSWILLLFCILVYDSNLRALASYDSVAASLIPLGLIRGDGFFLDRYDGVFPGRTGYSIVRSKTGHLVSLYPPVTPLLAAPLYLPGMFLFPEETRPKSILWRLPMEKLAASILSAASVVVIYSVLLRVASAGLALALTLAYAFGTPMWVTSSQALWQHGPATLLVALALLLLLEEYPSRSTLALLGLCAGLVTANRPMDVFFSIAVAWIVFRRHGRSGWPVFVCGGIVALLLCGYNLAHFGRPLGGYGAYRTPTGETLFRGAPDVRAFFALLFSNRGLFTFSPFLLFFFLSPTGSGPRKELLRPLLLASLATAVLYSFAEGWSGGYCYGHRYLITSLPVLMVALVGPLERVRRSSAATIAFVGAVTLSIAIQAIGAYCFPGGDSGNERRGAWTIRNSAPVLAAAAGIQPPDFLYLLAPGATMWRPFRSDEPAAAYEWASPPPRVWSARTRKRLSVWVWNRGRVTLSSFGGLFNEWAVVFRGTWRSDRGQTAPADPTPGSIEKPPAGMWFASRLAPGDAIRQSIDVTAPNATGRWNLSVELVQVGRAAFSEWGSPPLESTVTIVPGPEYDDYRRAVEWKTLEASPVLMAGSVVEIPVHLRNVSRLLWPPDVSLAYRWETRNGGPAGGPGLRTPLPWRAKTSAGDVVPARVRVDVPTGDYRLVFDLFQESGIPHWFAADEWSPALSVQAQVR